MLIVDTHSSVMVFPSKASFTTKTTTMQQYMEHNNHLRLVLLVKNWETIVHLILNKNTYGFKCNFGISCQGHCLKSSFKILKVLHSTVE